MAVTSPMVSRPKFIGGYWNQVFCQSLDATHHWLNQKPEAVNCICIPFYFGSEKSSLCDVQVWLLLIAARLWQHRWWCNSRHQTTNTSTINSPIGYVFTNNLLSKLSVIFLQFHKAFLTFSWLNKQEEVPCEPSWGEKCFGCVDEWVRK